MTLWLIRHAQVLLPPGICYGASDVAADAKTIPYQIFCNLRRVPRVYSGQ